MLASERPSTKAKIRQALVCAFEAYVANDHDALPPATALDKNKARRSQIAAHAVTTLVMLQTLTAKYSAAISTARAIALH
jgi:hypothetical protein